MTNDTPRWCKCGCRRHSQRSLRVMQHIANAAHKARTLTTTNPDNNR